MLSRKSTREYVRKKLQFKITSGMSIIILFILLFCLSVVSWYLVFNELEIIIDAIQTLYIITIGLFFIIASLKSQLINSITKAFLKLLFGVWVTVFIMLTSIDDINKCIIIIFCTLFIVYLEVLLEINDAINVSIVNIDEKKTLLGKNKYFLLRFSILIAVIIVSCIHGVLPFLLEDVLNTLLG